MGEKAIFRTTLDEMLMARTTNTWNTIFQQNGVIYVEPHEDMPTIVQLLRNKKAMRILDLGCGSGRHVVHLAQGGFSVHGFDNSPEGIELARQWLSREELEADLVIGDMSEGLPYEDEFFDAVISIQVIHHAKLRIIRKVVREIARVLRKNGFVFVTVTLLQKGHEGAMEEIEPNTFVPQSGPEKGMPHHRFSARELEEVFEGFEVTDVHVDNKEHLCLSAFKM